MTNEFNANQVDKVLFNLLQENAPTEESLAIEASQPMKDIYRAIPSVIQGYIRLNWRVQRPLVNVVLRFYKWMDKHDLLPPLEGVDLSKFMDLYIAEVYGELNK